MNNKYFIRHIVNFFLTIFIIVILLTSILLVLYYLSPNNYSLELFNESDLFVVKEYSITIKSGSDYFLNLKDTNDYYIKLFKPVKINQSIQLEILFQNFLKSQNIIYSDDKFIKTNFYSQIIIPNKFDETLEILIKFYKYK